jgi:hypothetical protein
MHPIEFQILQLVCRYYTLTRGQITRLLLPDDEDGRITRRHLVRLRQKNLINRTHMEVSNPDVGVMGPVYYPARDGCAYLAQECGDDTYFAVCTQTPHWQSLYHWVRVAETHVLIDRAAERLDGVLVATWYGEWDVLDPRGQEPQHRYRLYTLLRQTPKLVCVPDAAFLLDTLGHKKVFYLEQDRDTTKSADRVAAQKCGGYAGLAEVSGHRRHFPDMTVEAFTVLMVAPTTRRRDALRKAIGQKPGSRLWKFASLTDLTTDTLLTGDVWYPATGDAGPLIRPDALVRTEVRSLSGPDNASSNGQPAEVPA